MSAVLIAMLKLLLLPPVSLLTLATAGMLLGKRKWGKVMAVVCLTLLWLLSLPVVVNQLARFWERVPPLNAAVLDQFQAQALVVIGGGLDYGAPEYPGGITLHPRTLIRIRYAAKVAGQTGLPILVSGGGIDDTEEVTEADLMAAALDGEFKTPVAWREPNSSNTAENARFSRELLHRHGIDKIVLVTQAYHMPRAALAFRKAGFRVLPAPTAFIGSDGDTRLPDWLPSPAAWANSFLLAHEMIGMVWYQIRY